MGDVAGIGPEVIARGWADPRLHALARPLVIGDPGVLERAVALVDGTARTASPDRRRARRGRPVRRGSSRAWRSRRTMAICREVAPGIVDARAGRAAYEFLTTAARLALEGRIDAITTLPLNKQALHQSGVSHPGHTEILAEYCGVADHAMMLYLETNARPAASEPPAPAARRGTGLGVVHVTLHVALKQVFELVTTEAVLSKIRLADQAMRPLTGGLPPRIAVASLNPHAGEDGLFGDEEQDDHRPGRRPGQPRGHRRCRAISQRHPLSPRPGRCVRRRRGDVPRPGPHRAQDRRFRPRRQCDAWVCRSSAPAWRTERRSTSPGKAWPIRRA